MSANPTTRREFLQTAAILPLAALARTPVAEARRPLQVVAIGAHPDDPESGCGGTLRKFAVAGHAVTVLYLTRGEAGIEGKSHAEAAAIRTAEAERACALLGARARFFGQTDGASVFDADAVARMTAVLGELAPDVVLTHWPIDSHPDHQVASALGVQAWRRVTRPFELFFYEVCVGEQSAAFRPTDYVDITDVQPVKRAAVECHASQDPAWIYGEGGHALMEKFRGAECGVRAAEAFVRLAGPRAKGIV